MWRVLEGIGEVRKGELEKCKDFWRFHNIQFSIAVFFFFVCRRVGGGGGGRERDREMQDDA